MLEIRWFWKHWRTWEYVDVVDHKDRIAMRVAHLGCLVIVWHFMPEQYNPRSQRERDRWQM